MSVAVVRKKSTSPERPTLSPEKGNELLGLLLLAAARSSWSSAWGATIPRTPACCTASPRTAHAHNWAGSVGAQVSAVAFGFFGLTCFLIPLFLLVAGWRRLRRRGAAAGGGARVRRGAAARLDPGPPPDRLRPHRLDRRLGRGRRRLRRAARRLPAVAAQPRRHPGGARLGGRPRHGPGRAVDAGRTSSPPGATACASSGRTGPWPASAATSGGRRSATAGG